jgi:hypothetical protein
VLHQNQALLLSGVMVSMLGVALLLKAKATLAECYSPCSQQKIPPRVISAGPYAYIRHPIYTSNLLTVGGFVLAFGSAPAFLLFLYLLRVYIRSAVLEERVMTDNHPEYASLMKRTGRFLPRLWTILPGFRLRRLDDPDEISQFQEEFLNAGGFLKFEDSSSGQFTYYGFETKTGIKAGVAIHDRPYRSIFFLNHQQKAEVMQKIPKGTYEVTGLWKKKGAGFFPPLALLSLAAFLLIKNRKVQGAIVSATKEFYANTYRSYGFRSVYETSSPRSQGRMSVFLIEKQDGWKALMRIIGRYASRPLRA